MNSRYLANKSVVNLWFYIRDLEQTNVEGRFGGGGLILRYASPEKFWNFSPQKCFFHYTEDLLLQIATAFLLQSATSVITKCDRYYKVRQFYYKVRQSTVVLSDYCCRFRSSTVCSCTHSNREGGDWWDLLISVVFWSTQLSLLSDVFRQCWSFSSTKFFCKFRSHSGRSSRTFGFHCFVVLYHLLIDEINCSHTSIKIITKAV